MTKKIIYLIALFLPLNLFSIQNKFNYITPENGLSQGNITFIYQDNKGYMWIGTFSGLNRYDGYKCKVFNFDPKDTLSLSYERVLRICEDKEHKLWVGTAGGGVSVYYPQSGTFGRIQRVKDKDKEIVLRTISGLEMDSEGNIWVLDDNAGIFVFDPNLKFIKSFRHDPGNPKSLPNTSYFAMTFNTKGDCWLGAGSGTLCYLKKGSDEFEFYPLDDRATAVDDVIRSIYIDRLGIIWVGTTIQGAYCFNPENKSIVNYRKEDPINYISGNTVMAFCDDWDGNLLIGIDGGGLNILNRSSGQTTVIKYELGNPESLSTNAIYALYIDRSETLWIGTYAGSVNYQGRYRYKFKNFTPNPADPNSLSYKNVKSIMEDSDGDFWLGTDGGGLNKYNPYLNTFKHYRANPDNPKWLQTDVIIYMMQDKDGDIFIGSFAHGLTILNKETEVFRQYLPDESNPTSIGGMHPWYILQDSYDQIWVGFMTSGLDKFDKATESFTHYRSSIDDPTMLSNPNVKVLFEDSRQTLWVGTEGGGLNIYNRGDDNFTRFMYQPDVKGSISNNDIRAIFEDSKGNLWIGTSNGLNLMHRDSAIYFEVLTKQDGLPNNVINDILEDEKGNLWISTNYGISKFNPNTKTFRNYDITDGLQGNEFNYTAAIKSSTGEFYFGGKNGFNVFNPDDIIDNPHIPVIVLTDFQIFNKSVDKLEVRVNGRKKMLNLSEIDKITLTHKENVIGFEFSALEFGNPIKNKYKYKLEGFDKEWTDISATKRYASYTNLGGGRYTFRVIGSNSDGLWNMEGLSIRLNIKPPVWQRTWFILLIILAITYFTIRYLRNRREKIEANKEILEKKISDGLAELENQKKELALKDKTLQEKIESEKEQTWYNIGINKMSDVMSKNKDDLFKLSQSIITQTVEYIEVQQGAIYLLNDEKEDDRHLELMAAYAPDDKRLIGTRIEFEEGQIGACFKEQQILRVDNLPEGYAHLVSGLGESPLKHMVVVPLRLNEITIGVVELLSFTSIPDYRVDFVEKAGETLTSILTTLKANEKTKRLLETQKGLAEEMAAQEEELRQNLEEMQATQEELNRMREAEKKLMDQLKEQNKTLVEKQTALQKEEYLFNALLDNAKECIYFKDKESKFIRLSRSMLDLFKKKEFSELLGKSDFDFFDDEHARPAYDGEQEIIRTGIPIIDLIEKEVQKDGSISWVNTSKMPLIDQKGNIVGTWGISKNVSAAKQMEEAVHQSREKMLVYENMFETIINNMSAKVIILDEAGIIYVGNRVFAKSVNKKVTDLSGMQYLELLDASEQKSMREHFKTAKKKGISVWREDTADASLKTVGEKQLIRVFIEESNINYYLLIENN